jgi:hypothetical protein
MKISTSHTLAFVLAAVLGAGCASSSKPPKDEPPEKSLAERGFDEASRQMAEIVASLHFRGWKEHVTLTGEPPRPHVRLGTIRNESRVALDMDLFRRVLTRRLVDGGKVHVAPSREELAREDEALESEALDQQNDAGIMGPPPPHVSYLITGSVRDDMTERDGERTHTLIFDLRLLDVRDMTIEQQIHAYSSETVER